MNQLRGSVTAARWPHKPAVRFDSGDRNQAPYPAQCRALTAQDWGFPVGGLFYSFPLSASGLAYLFVECVRQVSLTQPLAWVCAASNYSTVTA